MNEASGVWIDPCVAQPHQVRCDTAKVPLEAGDDVAPEVGAGGDPVYEQHSWGVGWPGLDH